MQMEEAQMHLSKAILCQSEGVQWTDGLFASHSEHPWDKNLLDLTKQANRKKDAQ